MNPNNEQMGQGFHHHHREEGEGNNQQQGNQNYAQEQNYQQGGPQGQGYQAQNNYQQGPQGQGYQQGGNWGPQAHEYYNNAYQQGGNYDQMSHQDIYNHYQQAVQQVPPQQMYQAQQQYYNQMPPQQRQGLFSGLMNAFQQKGINPQQAGIQGNDPSPENLARASQYANQNPDLLQSVFGPNGALSSPLAKTALVGGLIFAGTQLFGNGNGNKGILGNVGGLFGNKQ